MNDITIKGKFLKRELIVLLLCMVVALALNVYSIITYQTQWIELLTYIPVMVLLSCVIYALLALVRLIIYWVRVLVVGKLLKKR